MSGILSATTHTLSERMNAPARATLRAVIIDLDGTMVDTAPDFDAAINGMRADLALPALPRKTIMDFVGRGVAHLVRSALEIDCDAAAVAARIDLAMASYQRHYAAVNGLYSSLYPDVTEGLAAFQAQSLRLACVTNKPVGFATELLNKTGLLPFFELVYGGDSLPTKKPDPGPLLQVCRDFDLSPSAVLMIGDSVNDARAARAAGCPVLLLPYGYNHGESVHGVDCDGIVATLLAAARLVAD